MEYSYYIFTDAGVVCHMHVSGNVYSEVSFVSILEETHCAGNGATSTQKLFFILFFLTIKFRNNILGLQLILQTLQLYGTII